MNYLISGGGTGGHIFPAIAIGEAIKELNPKANIYFVGTVYGMEKELIPNSGYPLLTLPMRGLLGKSASQKLALCWRLPLSLLMSLWLLIRYRPKTVIGVGGYASAPLMLMAGLLRFPTLVQEQNAVPGLSNKIAARFAKIACCGFSEAEKHFPCPAITTGNPVRKGFSAGSTWSRERKKILILGGSQGAVALNREIPKLLKTILKAEHQLEVIHQCGTRHLDAVRDAYGQVEFPLEIRPFIDNMNELMEHVLFAICRSGASTIAELKLLGIPAVLVPFPKATHDHQTFNAKSLADLGAALLIREDQLADAQDALTKLIEEPQQLAQMAAAYPKSNVNSAQVCAQIVLALESGDSVGEIVERYKVHVSQN